MLDVILFADDTNLFIFHNDPVYLINILNRELNKLSAWFAANRAQRDTTLQKNITLIHGLKKIT